ncbi:family 78 glycoside hydrolase catalytic domain [Halocatena salina]|uniref:alpha-L-rhamnosidase n=1 Tax=Halocatena salina TaxID=2934340 RepID=A0A8U0A7L1_9EURY|nr:family 78 glycoside hydrolase catalytic domain [Halocatena salina]UPM45181.1 family 78 glycoside hydrolase catalytic domain [Halocatena salina]
MSESTDRTRLSRPTELRVEYEERPTNVAPGTRPRFSWRVASDRRGGHQTAYRLIVGHDRTAVENGTGTVWDSGRVESTKATNVVYSGPRLAPDTDYYWSVIVWTNTGTTEWAAPARFSTALDNEQWTGDWIAHQPDGGDTNGWRSQWNPTDSTSNEWVQIDLCERREISSVGLHPAQPVVIIRTPDDTVVTMSWFENPLDGFGFPRGYRIEVADDPGFDDATLVVDTTDSLDDASVRRHEDLDARGRYVRVTATDLFDVQPSTTVGHRDTEVERHTEHVHAWQCFALAALTVHDRTGENLAHGRPVTASSSVETDTWGCDHLVNEHVTSRTASSSPLLRTEFTLDRPIETARAYVAAVGYGELHVNGDRVGERRLDPAWTDYERRVLYATHDITDQLTDGTNALGLWLGRGWFSKTHAYWVGDGSPRGRVVLTVEFEDGTTHTLTTNGEWRATESPIRENDVYDGEYYDARHEQDGWSSAGFDDSAWRPARVVDGPGGTLRPQRIEPMDVVETFDVEAVHDHPAGPILDFGQNLTGWLEIEIEGAESGAEITLHHAEALTDDGDLSTMDLRTADARDTYVARGIGIETYEPRFTYHGFRYVQVSGYPGELDPNRVTAKVVHTAMDRRGKFTCSNEDLNQLQHNAIWGLRGNTHSIPEDCPQRDERFGWTGDAHISTRALLFNFDAVRFDEKWIRDHEDAASPMGYVPDVIPNKHQENPADPTWSITRVMIPWYLYLHDGNDRILREQYEGMRQYVDYWYSVADDGIVPNDYGKFGDWLAFENADGRRGLPHALFNTAFLYQVIDTFVKIADALGNERDREIYRGRADHIATAFTDRFFDAEKGVYGPGTQSSYAVPLFVGLVPDTETECVVENLVEKVRTDGEQLTTGFLGTRPLIHTLATHGHADLAYEIVSQPDQPGWVYMVRNGATTMWERWNSDESVGSGMNSLNHSPFTHVSEFFYAILAGIRMGDVPVTEHVTIAPTLVDDLDWVNASVETPNGKLKVAWDRDGDRKYRLTVGIPWNTSATIHLPDIGGAIVSESGTVLEDNTVSGVRSIDRTDGTRMIEVGSGTYEFVVEPTS